VPVWAVTALAVAGAIAAFLPAARRVRRPEEAVRDGPEGHA
jgi:hypothetical protein